MMAKIDDAYDSLKSAKRCKGDGDYAGAIREACWCIELSLKALMDEVGVDYTKEREGKKWIPHDVSHKVPDAFEELEPYLEEYEVELVKEELARAVTLSKILCGALRNYLDFGILKMGAGDIFKGYPSNFGKDLAEVLVGRVKSAHHEIRRWARKAEKARDG